MKREVTSMRRLAVLTASIVFALSSSVLLGSASGSRTIKILGTEHFVPNALINANYRFSPGPLSVKSGESVTWANATNDGHTISIVPSVPATVSDVFGCGAPGTVCAPILACHFPQGFGPPVTVGCGNAANGELKVLGDSVLVGCTGTPGCQVPIPIPSTVTLKITAPAGSHLLYMCVIHAWMQGEIVVS